MDNNTILIVVAVILLVVVIYVLYKSLTANSKFVKTYCDGIWVIDSEFADNADLLEMLFVSDKDLGFLYIMANQGELFSGVVKKSLTTDFTMDLTGEIHGRLRLTAVETENQSILQEIYPDAIDVIIIPTEGSMIWKKQDETLAIFRKDTVTV